MKDEQDTQTPDMLEGITPGFRGAPPMVGWWEARRVEHLSTPFSTRRWWNGTGWSIPVSQGVSDVDAAYARNVPAVHRPDAFEWRGLHEPALRYDYALHAKTDEEAFRLSSEELDAQENLMHLAYGPEAEAKLERDRTDQDVAQHEEPPVETTRTILAGATRRTFHAD